MRLAIMVTVAEIENSCWPLHASLDLQSLSELLYLSRLYELSQLPDYQNSQHRQICKNILESTFSLPVGQVPFYL